MKNKIYKLWAFSLLAMLLSEKVFSQQDAQFSQYMFNQLFLNPATAGINDESIEFGLIHRSQWLGYTATFDDGGAPSTQVASFNMPIYSINSGWGMHFVNDRLGPLSNLELQLSYAYHHVFKNKAKLSFGARMGIYNQSINGKWRYVDADDPYIPEGGGVSQLKPDFGFGVYYSTRKFFSGLSLNHLNAAGFSYAQGITISSLNRHMTAIIGNHFELDEKSVLTPSVLLKSDFNTISVEPSLLYYYKKDFFFGVSSRASNALDAVIAIVGFNVLKDKSLQLRYSFDYVTSGQSAKKPTSHEIGVAYRMRTPKPVLPAVIRTPRFRH
jgi:type IX secretion system PorP/SprF family membrane protein